MTAPTKMTIDEALGQPGELIAAWDGAADLDEWLGVFAVSAAGARLLAHERMPVERRAAREAELRGRGVRLGSTCGTNPHVWSGAPDRFAVWSDHARVAEATKAEVALGGTRVPVAAIRAVVSFVAPRDKGHRGVRLERRGGTALVLAEEHDPAAQAESDLQPRQPRPRRGLGQAAGARTRPVPRGGARQPAAVTR